ncbi:precorrin-6A synthase (deacetylating), partial [Salmonella enterica subsp. enterica]|nr:precorrin-6A synthase (deacetylating) [Salmonella enterica subsp. enterica serovar Enteritidis]
EAELTEAETGGLLVWGDPSLYDSTLRILDRLQARPDVHLDYDVIPGVTAVQALAAAHKVTLNNIGEPFVTTTGRRLGEGGMPQGNAVIMLDGELAFQSVDPDLWIYWGAYLGSPDELLVAGRVGDVADEIVRRRSEARARKGWIMDIYLLKRRPTGEA